MPHFISALCSVFQWRQQLCGLWEENKDIGFTLCNCVMTCWNSFLCDILSTLLTPCTINLIQARSINPRWLCCVQDNSNEYFHLLRTQEQQETGKLVLLYYVDATAFCSIDRIQQLRRVCVLGGVKVIKGKKAETKHFMFIHFLNQPMFFFFLQTKLLHFNNCRCSV